MRRCHGAEPRSDLVCAFGIFVLRRNRQPFTFSLCMYKENLKEVQRRRFNNIFIGGVKCRFGIGSLGELTGAFCSLHPFTPVSFEESSHGSFSSNNDTGRACRKEDLCGILFPCAAWMRVSAILLCGSCCQQLTCLVLRLAALLQHNFRWGSPFSPQNWVLDKSSGFWVQNTQDNEVYS